MAWSLTLAGPLGRAHPWRWLLQLLSSVDQLWHGQGLRVHFAATLGPWEELQRRVQRALRCPHAAGSGPGVRAGDKGTPVATRDFAVRTENHVANLGELGKLEFVPEVFGDGRGAAVPVCAGVRLVPRGMAVRRAVHAAAGPADRQPRGVLAHPERTRGRARGRAEAADRGGDPPALRRSTLRRGAGEPAGGHREAVHAGQPAPVPEPAAGGPPDPPSRARPAGTRGTGTHCATVSGCAPVGAWTSRSRAGTAPRRAARTPATWSFSEFARAWNARPPRLPKLKVASSLVRADVGGRR